MDMSHRKYFSVVVGNIGEIIWNIPRIVHQKNNDTIFIGAKYC